MKLKSIIGGVLSLAAAGLASPGYAQTPDWLQGELKKPLEEVTVGFASLGTGVNAYVATYVETFTNYAKELGVKAVILDAQADPAKQSDQISDLIAQNVDVMVVWPVNGKAVVPAVRRVHSAGIPVVITNSKIDASGESYTTTFSGPDDFTEANIAGKLMVEALGGKGNIVMISSTPGYSVSQLREAGFLAAIKDHPDIKILDSQPAYSAPDKAQAIMENYITRYGKQIDGVYSHDAGMGVGALAAVRAAVKEGKLDAGHVKFTDCTMFGSVYDAIKAGDYYGSVYQSPAEDAKAALKAAILVAEGRDVPKTIILETPPVTAANIDSFDRPNF